LSDDSETQDPTSLREQPASDIVILQELRELKELVKDVQKRQSNMEKTLKNLASKLGTHEFDLAKSSHAVSIFSQKKISNDTFFFCVRPVDRCSLFSFWFYNVFKTKSITTGKCNKNIGKGIHTTGTVFQVQ
jgi:hypothetical protein